MACLADLADAPVIGRHPMKPAPDLLPLLERPATSSATVGPAPLLTPPLAPSPRLPPDSLPSAVLLPLLSPRDPAAPFAWRDGRALSVAQFLAAAERLAERLPADGRAVNLCCDRLLMALGLAAALRRGHLSLMPPNTLAATLRQLPADARPAYVLSDDSAVDTAGMALVSLTAADLEVPAAALPLVPQVPLLDAAQPAVCLLTSGSTGAPQPHVKCWGPLAANIGAEAARLAELLGRADLAGLTLVATVPGQHSYGLESSVLLALLGGAVLDAGRPFYPADIAAALARLPRPRALVTTPFHLKALLGAGLALPAADLVLSATAPLTPQLAARAEAALGAPLIEIYGCTEAGQVATRRTTAGETWHALRGLRLSRRTGATTAATIPADATAPASDVAIGDEHFIVEGGHVGAPTPLADRLELVDAEHFRLLGRGNDVVNVAGKRSSLAHLNFVLNRIDGVDDGAFWLPDEVPGAATRPLAFVVAPRRSAREIVAALRRELESAFVPRRVLHVAALPREATGKLTSAALRHFALTALATLAQRDGTPARCDGTRTPDEGTIALHVAADHPAFDGHFPGQPVLPGATLLAFVLDALQARPSLRNRLGAALVVEQVKFLATVGPGTALALRFTPRGRAIGFEVSAGTTVVARGVLGSLVG